MDSFSILQIFLHGSDINALSGFISNNILPVEYGGTADHFDNNAWYMKLLAEEEYFKNLATFGYKSNEILEENDGN